MRKNVREWGREEARGRNKNRYQKKKEKKIK